MLAQLIMPSHRGTEHLGDGIGARKDEAADDDANLPALPLKPNVSPMIKYLKTPGIERIVVLPVPNEQQTCFQSAPDARASDDHLREFGRRNGVEVVPLHKHFLGDKYRVRDLYLLADTHLSPAGMLLPGRNVGACFQW